MGIVICMHFRIERRLQNNLKQDMSMFSSSATLLGNRTFQKLFPNLLLCKNTQISNSNISSLKTLTVNALFYSMFSCFKLVWIFNSLEYFLYWYMVPPQMPVLVDKANAYSVDSFPHRSEGFYGCFCLLICFFFLLRQDLCFGILTLLFNHLLHKSCVGM